MSLLIYCLSSNVLVIFNRNNNLCSIIINVKIQLNLSQHCPSPIEIIQAVFSTLINISFSITCVFIISIGR